MLLGLPHNLEAMPQRPRRATVDPVGVRVESDTKKRVPFARERPETFEVAHGTTNRNGG